MTTTGRWMICAITVSLGIASASPAGTSTRLRGGLKVERVVILMRHGVRPPTKDPALPPGVAADAWPRWPVPPGWLTPHGAQAIAMLGTADRTVLRDEGIFPAAGCPGEGAVAVSSDSDERTIATGDVYLKGLAPGCVIANRHLEQNAPDPLFHDPAVARVDPADANRAVTAALGPEGVAGVVRRRREALRTVDRILCGDRAGQCGIASMPSEIIAGQPGRLPKLGGALDLGSSAAQSILLEYAEGKPMSDVGWGRASARDIALIGELHSQSFAIQARPRPLAAANAAGIVKLVLGALTRATAKLTVIVGHDTNVANLAGLLDLHWQAPGFAADDPAPGGALIFELLRDPSGRQSVRVVYRTQSLEQIRHLLPRPPEREPLALRSCGGLMLCPLSRFSAILSNRQ